MDVTAEIVLKTAKETIPMLFNKDRVHPRMLLTTELMLKYSDGASLKTLLTNYNNSLGVNYAINTLNAFIEKNSVQDFLNACPQFPADLTWFKILDEYIAVISSKLMDLLKDNNNVTFVSVGAGNGETEQKLYNYLQSNSKGVLDKIKWLGLDPHLPKDSSFYRVTPTAKFLNRSILDVNHLNELIDTSSPFVVTALFSLHHTPISISDYQKKIKGCSGSIIIEQLETSVEASDNLAKLIRVYSDLLSNYIVNPQWGDVFLNNPSAFYVNYLKYSDVINAGYKVQYFGNHSVQLLTQ